MRVFQIAIIICALTFTLTSVAAYNVSLTMLQENDTIQQQNIQSTKQTEQAKKETLETIQIDGVKPLRYYRKQLELAELNFYDLYNSLVDEEQFLMYCRKEKDVGSHIKRTRCYPQYFLQIYANESQDAFSSTSYYDLAQGIVRNPPSYKMVEELAQRKQKEALEYVEKVVSENPVLLNQLVKMEAARNTYEAKKLGKNTK